jgi:hypothetical protein
MAKAKSTVHNYNEKVAIKGEFMDVFKVVKKDKERKAQNKKKKP